MWETINKVPNKNQTSTTPKSIMFGSQLVEKSNQIAEAFKIHFTTIGPKLAEKIETKESDDPLKHSTLSELSTTPCFKFQPVDPKTIESEIKKLKCSKSAGYHKVSVKLLKLAAGILSKPLAAIFNSSLETGNFPDIWKIARVTAIFKSGQKNNMNNYRPISVLSVFSRLLEKLGHDQVSHYLEAQSKFSKCQHAFLKMNNTLTAFLNITDSWFSNVDKRKIHISVFLDHKKTFGTVDHGILLPKLSKCGIAGTHLR